MSGDGDFVPVVEAVQTQGKRVVLVAPATCFSGIRQMSGKLEDAVNDVIRLDDAEFSALCRPRRSPRGP